jgi:hypothetical protein
MGGIIAKGTAMFLVGIMEYEGFLEQRRRNRHKKRKVQVGVDRQVEYL